MARRGRINLYDWDKWFARARFTLQRGRDYQCTTMGMVQQVRNAACRRGLNIQMVEATDGITVLVVGRGGVGRLAGVGGGR